MSDLSFFWCKSCLKPEPYCDCGDDANLESETPIAKIRRGMDRDDIWELNVDWELHRDHPRNRT